MPASSVPWALKLCIYCMVDPDKQGKLNFSGGGFKISCTSSFTFLTIGPYHCFVVYLKSALIIAGN